MEPELVAALERQNQLLERIAIALERMRPAVAPNYQASLETFLSYDWAAIGAEVTARDADGPTIVTVNGVQYSRQTSSQQSSPALWFSRCLGQSDAPETHSERLITFKLASVMEPTPLPESVKRGITPPPSPLPAAVTEAAHSPQQPTPPTPTPALPQHPAQGSAVVARTDENLAPQNVGLVNQNQLKRLWAIANEYHWTKPGVHLLLREGYQLDSSKDIRADQYEQICSQLSAVPATPYNTKAAASDPKANLKRLRALTRVLGLDGKTGDHLIKSTLTEKHPGKKSAELSSPEVEGVRDAMLIHYGQQQFPAAWKSIVGVQYLELVSELGEVSDTELAYRWMDKFSELLKSVK